MGKIHCRGCHRTYPTRQDANICAAADRNDLVALRALYRELFGRDLAVTR